MPDGCPPAQSCAGLINHGDSSDLREARGRQLRGLFRAATVDLP